MTDTRRFMDVLRGGRQTRPRRPTAWLLQVQSPQTRAPRLRRAARARLPQVVGQDTADHKHDRRAWVFEALGIALNHPNAELYAWERARPDDPDVLPLSHRLLRAVGERVRWRRALDEAKARAVGQEEAAERLGTGERFVRRLIAERRIAFTRYGAPGSPVRIAERDLIAFVSAGRVEARQGVV